MKYILQVVANLIIGGAEKVAADIALYAPDDEYEFHYVVFGDEVGEYEKQLVEKGCKVFHIPSPSHSYKAYINNLKQLMQEYNYTAVHAHTMFNIGLVMFAAKAMKVPVRVSHSHSALTDGNNIKKSVYEWIMRRMILSCSTELVACGSNAGERLYGKRAFKKRGKLVLNGIDTKKFGYSQEARNKIREQLMLQDKFIIGHAGHLAEVKNQSFLIEMMPELLKKEKNAVLLLLGEGEDRPMLEQKIKDLKLEENVIMTGNVSNVFEYLSAMDVFVLPSIYEGMPLSIIEVQANGLPCILSEGVPKDVYLTDLIKPLSIYGDKNDWIDEILNSKRSEPEVYWEKLKNAGFDAETVMEKFYRIYENKNIIFH